MANTSKKKPTRKTKEGKIDRRLLNGSETKLDFTTAKAICDLIRAGCWPDIAAQASGISTKSLERWMAKGKAYLDAEQGNGKKIPADARYATFHEDVLRATAEGEVLDMDKLNAFADTIPQALFFKMSRRWKDRWADTQKHEVTGKDGKPIVSQHAHVHGTITGEELLKSLSIDAKKEILDLIRKQKQQAIGGPSSESSKEESPEAEIES